jgi:hypothetical protein
MCAGCQVIAGTCLQCWAKRSAAVEGTQRRAGLDFGWGGCIEGPAGGSAVGAAGQLRPLPNHPMLQDGRRRVVARALFRASRAAGQARPGLRCHKPVHQRQRRAHGVRGAVASGLVPNRTGTGNRPDRSGRCWTPPMALNPQ